MSEDLFTEESLDLIGASADTSWITVTESSFIVNDSNMPITPWRKVRKGEHFVSFGTGRMEGQTYYFSRESDAKRFYEELKQIQVVTMIQMGIVQKVAYRPETMTEG